MLQSTTAEAVTLGRRKLANKAAEVVQARQRSRSRSRARSYSRSRSLSTSRRLIALLLRLHGGGYLGYIIAGFRAT